MPENKKETETKKKVKLENNSMPQSVSNLPSNFSFFKNYPDEEVNICLGKKEFSQGSARRASAQQKGSTLYELKKLYEFLKKITLYEF